MSGQKLLIAYLFVYPAYYLVAIFVNALIFWMMFGWDFQHAQRYFCAFGLVMWIASYMIHYEILKYAVTILRQDKQAIQSEN